MKKEWYDYLELIKERPEEFLERNEMNIVVDEKKVTEYEQQTGKTIGVIYKSNYHLLIVDLIEEDGKYYTYERLLPSVKEEAVVAIPIYNNKFVLLKQFRHTLRDFQYAFPRGGGEPGISAEENVKKEVVEEIGAKVLDTKFVGTIVADSGFCGNKVYVYKCVVENVELKYHYEGIEDVILLSKEELKQWIKEGKITDGFTLSAISLSNIMNE